MSRKISSLCKSETASVETISSKSHRRFPKYPCRNATHNRRARLRPRSSPRAAPWRAGGRGGRGEEGEEEGEGPPYLLPYLVEVAQQQRRVLLGALHRRQVAVAQVAVPIAVHHRLQQQQRHLERCEPHTTACTVGVARFVDASIYRDTFPAIRIAILFFIFTILFFYFLYNDFHVCRKDT